MYGFLEEHRESRHAVERVGKEERCMLCGESNFIFTSRLVTLDHLSQHANLHLYKCVLCDFTYVTLFEL